MSESEIVVYEGSGEWSAVYVDGNLKRVGDHYLADEWIRAHFGVETVQSDDFMRGGDFRDTVAVNLGEIEAYKSDREVREVMALALEEEAAAALERAAALRNGED